MRNCTLRTGVAAAALAAATPAWSQDKPVSPPSAAAPAPAPASGGTSSDQGDIIVVAQRRAEKLQDVPISVTAVTSAAIARTGATTTENLTSLVPGLVFTRSTQSAQPTIRGIGGRNGSTGNEGNVAVYVDGVYQAQPFGNLFNLADIDQIEVLKGPQVTLYGRNATGGAINVRTRAPSFTPVGKFSASYGSYDYHAGSAYLSGPLSNDIAASVAVSGFADNGYIDNIFLHEKEGESSTISVRGKLLWKPSDRFDITFNGFYASSNFPEAYSGHFVDGNSLTRILPNPNNYPIDLVVPTGDYETAGQYRPKGLIKIASGGANARYDLGFATLTALIDYKSINGNQIYDLDATAISLIHAQIKPESRSWYGEAVLTSNGDGRFKWLAGANFFDDKTQTNPQIVFPSSIVDYGVKTAAYSAYAEGTLEPIDNLFFTAGLRYSNEKKSAFNRPLDANMVPIPGKSVGASKRWDAWTPRFVARYEFSPSNNIYASFSKGFKSGSFDASSALGAVTPVDPENVNAYEIGVKTRLMPGVTINGAVFRYDYQDLQVTSLFSGLDANGNPFTFARLGNAAQARINGAELTGSFTVTHAFHIEANLSYLDTKFTSFPNASFNVPNIVNGLPSGNKSVVGDLTRKQLMRAPKWTGSISATYEVDDLFGGSLLLDGSVFRSALYYGDVNNRVEQPAYTLLNLGATWRMQPDKGLYLRIQGKNLTSAKIATQLFITGTSDEITLQKPANWLLTVGYDF